ncbi:hypothetical protein AA14337_3199 [Acetobacter malorum DSM 14337]|uniref:Phage protein n=1 Tax=Acetobacter malorum DSM 14337 TaxID=1307910 RepID=A0ABQ0Q088_9PROT|nr:hypothetical protein [Acetobacter malorum]KXV05778.1 hypothetical protein AD930_11695 [Acetobacter malorum]GBQ85931.1 hypothetical protein AA14337_3199 [Acetobacter malorum DSM 14337]
MAENKPSGIEPHGSGLIILGVMREARNSNCPKWVPVEIDDVPHYQVKGDRIEEVVAKSEAEKTIAGLEGLIEASTEREDSLIESLDAATKALAKAIAMRDHGCEWSSLTVSEMEGMIGTAQEEIDNCLGTSELAGT